MEEYQWRTEDNRNLAKELRLSRFAGENPDTVRIKNLIMDLHRRLSRSEERIQELERDLSALADRDQLC